MNIPALRTTWFLICCKESGCSSSSCLSGKTLLFWRNLISDSIRLLNILMSACQVTQHCCRLLFNSEYSFPLYRWLRRDKHNLPAESCAYRVSFSGVVYCRFITQVRKLQRRDKYWRQEVWITIEVKISSSSKNWYPQGLMETDTTEKHNRNRTLIKCNTGTSGCGVQGPWGVWAQELQKGDIHVTRANHKSWANYGD